METKLIDDSFDKDLFDSKATYPLQCWEWGEAKKELGNEVVRVGEFDGDKLLNVFQLTLHKIPKTSYKIAYLPRSVFPSEKTITFLKEFAANNKIVFIKLEPNVAKRDAPKILPADIVKSSHPLLPAWTQILDLKPSEEELLKNLKQKKENLDLTILKDCLN
jgi:lipid II:glycine glycyltransferase (peptidoglycan interpeptide bridge formation enzyme)